MRRAWLLLLLGALGCPTAPATPLTGLAPTSRPTAPLALGLGAPTTLVGGGASSNYLEWIVWVTTGGTVMQRAGLSGPSVVVPGLTDVTSVAVGFAVTRTGELFRWSPGAAVLQPVKVLDGVVDVSADYGAFALLADGHVVDLGTMSQLPDVADVVAMRITGFEQAIISGGGQYSRSSRFFLTKTGTVLLQDVVRYLSNQLPNTLSTTQYATGVREVSTSGFIQSPDGLVFFQDALVHDVPARKFASTPRVATQSNATTLGSGTTTYVLFDDGALWASSVSKTSGENQQGAPTFSASATQEPVRLQGDAAIADFALLGPVLLVFDASGRSLARPGDAFLPVEFEDLRR